MCESLWLLYKRTHVRTDWYYHTSYLFFGRAEFGNWLQVFCNNIVLFERLISHKLFYKRHAQMKKFYKSWNFHKQNTLSDVTYWDKKKYFPVKIRGFYQRGEHDCFFYCLYSTVLKWMENFVGDVAKTKPSFEQTPSWRRLFDRIYQLSYWTYNKSLWKRLLWSRKNQMIPAFLI